MPKIQFRKYSEEDLEKAISAVKRGQSYKSAAKQYGVQRTTLMNKCKGRSAVNCRMGPSTILSSEEETHLEQWLIHIASRGFPATKFQLIQSVELLCNNRNGKRNLQVESQEKSGLHLF